METTLYYKGSFPYERLLASMPSLPEGFKVSILSTSLRWLITYNVLIGDAEEAEEFLEAEEVDEFLEAAEVDEFLETSEAFTV